MKLTFLGAAQTVTGSCYLLEANGKSILVDCGMFQGSKLVTSFNERPFLFEPAKIDAVILTHAHIDHCGLLPKLVVEGFKGPIYSTKVTYELCSILLPDSAHIQESDAENATRKRLRAGKEPRKPLYTVDQAFETLKYFQFIEYHEMTEILPSISVRLNVAGHIMGASMAEIFVDEDGDKTKLFFSGDVGQPEQPILKDPDVIDYADYMIIESTYGDRIHGQFDVESEIASIINQTVERGGNIIIPAFAVGRTQILLYYLQKLSNSGLIPKIPIIIDSPLATKATNITLKNPQEFDEESLEMYHQYRNKLIDLPQLRFTQSAQESRQLNETAGPMIIISASGMADAGRILHHLKHNLWRSECSVVFVGYQARGSMGRMLLDGTKRVRLFGETISVKAQIFNMTNFSAHADKEQLISWLKKMDKPPKGFFVTHGEYDAATAFSGELVRTIGAKTYVPGYGDVATIDKNGWQIQEAQKLEAAPAIAQLREELRTIEKKYNEYKVRMEQLLSASPTKYSDLKRRIGRIDKFVDNIFEDL